MTQVLGKKLWVWGQHPELSSIDIVDLPRTRAGGREEAEHSSLHLVILEDIVLLRGRQGHMRPDLMESRLLGSWPLGEWANWMEGVAVVWMLDLRLVFELWIKLKWI